MGTSGSGKTTFSRELASILTLPYIELDQVFWKPNWNHLEDDELYQRVREKTDSPDWVLDGNYSRTTSIKWSKVECVIWLDFSFGVTVYRAVTRAVKRAISQEELWPNTGNRESFRMSFFSKESVVLWTLQSYHTNRRKYLQIMEGPTYKGIDFVRLRSPKEAERFLDGLRQYSK